MSEFDEQLLRDLEAYELGRQLQRVVATPAWEIIINTLNNMADDAKDALVALPPGHENVVTAHAAASAASDIVRNFKQGIEGAVYLAQHPSDELKAYIHQALESRDVVKQQKN